jgi:hypothetical protein
MEFTLFSKNQGCGYISKDYYFVNDVTIKHETPIVLGRQELIPGNSFDLDGFFSRPLLYLGKHVSATANQKGQYEIPLKEKLSDELIFYIGEDDGNHYFQAVFKITDTRFFMLYGKGSGRDYNFKNNKWK